MNLQQLENMITLADCKNITRAAEKCFISQSALTQQLAGIESALGVPLFKRDRNGMILTPAGEVYIDAARKILAIQRSAYRTINELSDSRSAELCVGITQGIGGLLLSKVFHEFHETFPGINLQPHMGHGNYLRSHIVLGDLDLSFFTIGDDDLEKGDYDLLLREEFLLIAAKSSPLLHNVEPDENGIYRLDLSAAKNEKFILPVTGGINRSIIDNAFQKAGFKPAEFIHPAIAELRIAMVEEGLCCSFLEMHNSRLLTPGIGIVRLTDPPRLNFVAYYNRKTHLGRSGNWLIDRLKRVFEEELTLGM